MWSLMREMREKRLSEIDEWNRRPRGPKPKTPPRVDEQRLLSTTESYEIGQRAKKKIDAKKKDEGQSLARTLACNAGLVQRHSLDEVVRRRRLRESEEVRRRTARERDAQHESQMRARAARESTVEARRLHRRMSRVLMLEKTTSNSLSSSRKFKQSRPWTNFSSLFDGETNKKEFMKKRLSKYAEDRWMDKALARSVEHFGPTPNFRVLDGSAHFFS